VSDDEGPLLESLTHRLSECPPEFLLAPRTRSGGGEVEVAAIVLDHLRAMKAPLPASAARPFAHDGSTVATNRLRLIAVATWLLHDDWFLSRPRLAAPTWNLFAKELDELATVVKAEQVISDPDRREELVRVCLKHLGLRPRGETPAQAVDRLTVLDSAERLKVMRQTRDAEARARKIREQMAAEAARAAAARYSPE
jgi:hypothetical protein